LGSQDQVDLSAIVGKKYRRTTPRDAELGTESMIVSVFVPAQQAIGIRQFTPKPRAFALHRLSREEFDVAFLCELLRFGQVCR
jgi:hypothetical protein